MNSHNTKAESGPELKSVRIASDEDDVRVVSANLLEAAELSISEEDDKGSDPYNSTGQHVIIKVKIDLQG